MRMKYSIGGLIILAVALIGFSVLSGGAVRTWNDTEIACLPNGHQSLEMHFHPELTITVNDTNERVPVNIGITPNCMAEVHTHDTTGQIHVESVTPDRTFVVGDFFAVWGEPLAREGYVLRASIDGEVYEEADEIAAVAMSDGMQINLAYTSVGTNASDEEVASTTTRSGE